LYGRVDLEINLLPFSVQETMRFFENNRTRDEVLEIYMTLGGIPQYLLELDPKKSLVQNLDILAFHPYGYFFTEYQKLFISHFSRNKNYEKILKLLSGRYVQSIDEVAKKIKLKSGGTFTELLDDLEFAGFIERFHPIDKKEGSKIIKIKIHDEFLHFYFSFVDKNKHYIEEGSIKSYEILTSNQFKQWRGYAFERFCRKNTRLIAKTLEFSGIRYEHGSWFRKDLPEITQIDLVFKRADNVLTVCEIKYVDTLSNNLTTEFERKVEILHNYFSCSIQKVLILGKKITVPKKIERFFDIILFADDIF